MAMDIEQVRWISHLARLELDDNELESMARQLGNIIQYFDQLQKVNTLGVEPLAHPLPVSNVFRDDELSTSLTPDQALANAPSRQGDYFSVPTVFD